ncbi:MAG TPA: ATPase, T2SS/T4P/T4SS family [Vicinamibacterales bacterium]|nr:ATPase, T2SS/T4P/T4SS family [Vicinamibacterales bacterium]
MSWDVIIPFLRPIESFLRDPDVSDVMVNGTGAVFVERDGQMRQVADVAIPEKSLQVAVRNIARVLGDDISEECPLLDARLPDGSRVAAVFPPCSIGGTTLTIRKFQSKRYTVEELVRVGTLTTDLLDRMREAVGSRQNILISGGTGTGKTTLLNALAAFIPDEERLVVIEDTSEMQIDKPNLVRLEARRERPDLRAVTMRELLKATLRLRPDRILLGEVRGEEAFDLLQALNTGHAGTLSTIHANSGREGLSRFTTCVLQSGVSLPYRAVRRSIAESVNLLVYLSRRQGKRFVTEVLQVRGYDPDQDRYELEQVYER